MAEKEDKKGRGREEMRKLSVTAYNIDLLLPPINYPQKWTARHWENRDGRMDRERECWDGGCK